MSIPFNVEPVNLPVFNIEQVASRFIQSHELPDPDALNQQLVNDLARRVLLSGQATPQHFQELKNVTCINFEDAKNPIEVSVLKEIFTQYKDSLVELRIGRISQQEGTVFEIADTLKNLKVLQISPSLSCEQVAEIIRNAIPQEGNRIVVEVKNYEHFDYVLLLRDSYMQQPDSNSQRIEIVFTISDNVDDATSDVMLDDISTRAGDSIVGLTLGIADVRRLTQSFPRLRILDAQIKVRDLGELHVFRTLMGNLESGCIDLDLSEFAGLNDETFQEIARLYGDKIVGLNLAQRIGIKLKGSDFKNLERLDVSYTDTTDEMLLEIALKCSGLRYLNVYSCGKVKLTGCYFRKLETLIATYTDVDDSTLRNIVNQSLHLKRLDVDHCEKVTFSGYIMKRLQWLSAKYTALSNETLREVSVNSRKLTYVAVAGCEGLTLEDCKFRNLRYLDVTMTAAADEILQVIAANSPLLEQLFVGACANVTLADCNLVNLKVLNASWTRINDTVLRKIAHDSRDLKDLDVTACQVTLEDCDLGNIESIRAKDTWINDAVLTWGATHWLKLRFLKATGSEMTLTHRQIQQLGEAWAELQVRP